ncbi:hypothetical protein H70357_00590 [Paenibacillus sp. FSL H7-0357]|uniref:Transposase DDE domain-containing protein n=1 Tax=Paenibacillus borealis TaxID=160799 RepID=A0ABX3GW13_PAEBO|nr:hypothetical protein H70357_00590 [Paenibacillus sp. FSL H7-0357]OMD38757.1 hypothetical protein BSK56_30185 [Paenibacillus borealis]
MALYFLHIFCTEPAVCLFQKRRFITDFLALGQPGTYDQIELLCSCPCKQWLQHPKALQTFRNARNKSPYQDRKANLPASHRN